MITCEKQIDGTYTCSTDCYPSMTVNADSEKIGRDIIDRATGWRMERDAALREAEMLEALAEMELLQPPAETAVDNVDSLGLKEPLLNDATLTNMNQFLDQKKLEQKAAEPNGDVADNHYHK